MQVSAATVEAIRAQLLNRLQFYRPGAGQLRYHKSQSRYRFNRSANQVGKTVSGAAEMWWHALGQHPHRRVKAPPTNGWILIADFDNQYGEFCRKLRQLEPAHALDTEQKYDDVKGYTYRGRRAIRLQNGSTIGFRGGESNVVALAGATIDWGWIDEPPKQHHFGEFMARVQVSGGPVWFTCTPIGRPVDWLKKLIEGDAENNEPPAPGWEQFVIPLSPENCPWRSAESIQAQIDITPYWERPQRIYGEWEGVEPNRWLASFGADNLCNVVPEGNYRLVIGLDHGERAGRQVAVIAAMTRSIDPDIWILGEYVSKGSTTPLEDAQGIQAALKQIGFTLLHVDEARGDHNTAGKSQAGIGINALLEQSFAVLMGHPQHAPPFRVYPATKGAGSVEYGARLLNSLFLRRKLYIHEKCENLIKSLKYWDGTKNTDDFKHLIDALRYCVVDEYSRIDGPNTLQVRI